MVGVRGAAEEPICFVSPADHAQPAAAGEEAAPAAPVALENPAAKVPAIDFAALANFSQVTPAAPEEIVGAPLPEDPQLLDTSSFRPITQVTVNTALPAGIFPGGPGVEQAGVPTPPWPRFEDARFWGGWAETNYQWSATMLCHRPLYFEQVNVERYGYTVSPILQPAISFVHFFATIPTIPYKMVVQPPRECIYTLGYYRAGSPAPRRWHHLTWDPTAATVEGFLATGLVFLIP
jgi:hypothetical protein